MMKGDFSRLTFPNAKEKHYSGVLMQQGRVQLDADWNEQVAIHQDRVETGTRDGTGLCGAPRYDSGFEITVEDGKLEIGAGRYYVDGILCENPAKVPYEAQEDLLNPPNLNTLLTGTGIQMGLVYLDVWHRHVTALDDDHIREKALGGPDTTTRVKTVWQVKVLPLSTSADPEQIRDRLRRRQDLGISEWGTLTTPITAPSRGKINARTRTPNNGEGEEPCLLPPSAGYQGLENQLYRVELQKGGSRATATFKWSRENGSVSAAIERIDGVEITVRDTARDDVLGFASGQWVEIVDDRNELREPPEPNPLLQIEKVDPATRTITLKSPASAVDLARHPKLRRWDQTGPSAAADGVGMTSDWIPLENGIEVQFSDGEFKTGDYWLIPARTVTGEIEWPPFDVPNNNPVPQPSLGILHHYCPLALIELRDSNLTLTGDCRLIFPPLTHLTADEVSFDNSTCDLPGAKTVQDAIDAICRNRRGGCTVVPIPGNGWERILDQIGDGQDVHICFQVGTYPLQQTLTLKDKGNVKISGCGSGTRILASKSEMAIRFDNCKSVLIRDLYAETGITGSAGRTENLNGTLSFLSCPSVTIEGVHLKCASGAKRAATCLTVNNAASSPGQARVRHCHLEIGHQQAGILLVNMARAQVEDNALFVRERPTSLEFSRLLKDKKYRARVRNRLIGSAYLGKRPPTGVHNATVSFSGNEVRFKTETPLASEWQGLINANPPAKAESGGDVLMHLKKTADRILLDENFRRTSRAFMSWYTAISQQQAVAASQGIAVGGSVANDVRILNNTIQGALQGIHLGVSKRGPASSTYDQAGTVTIAGNTIEVNLIPEAVRDRHGIFVGNCDSLIVENNYLRVLRFNTQGLSIEGIRIHGYLGRMMIVRQNHLVNVSTGIFVRPLNGGGTSLWLVSYNMIPRSAKQVDAPDRVMKDHNFA